MQVKYRSLGSLEFGPRGADLRECCWESQSGANCDGPDPSGTCEYAVVLWIDKEGLPGLTSTWVGSQDSRPLLPAFLNFVCLFGSPGCRKKGIRPARP